MMLWKVRKIQTAISDLVEGVQNTMFTMEIFLS